MQLNLVTKLFSAVLMGTGSVLLIGGTQLIWLGGSLYYVLSGATLIAAGSRMWQGRSTGYWLYFGFAAATLVWAIIESGFNLWALLPRLWIPLALLCCLLLPMIKRDLQVGPKGNAAAALMLAAYGALLLTGAVNAQFTPKVGPQRALDSARQAPQWTHYGATAGGNSYSDGRC